MAHNNYKTRRDSENLQGKKPQAALEASKTKLRCRFFSYCESIVFPPRLALYVTSFKAVDKYFYSGISFSNSFLTHLLRSRMSCCGQWENGVSSNLCRRKWPR